MSGKAVHRLLDIVVEEVSLVDRAANKHRFLLVKRDEGEGVDDDNDDLNQDDPAGGEPENDPATAPATLEIAAKALSSLTDAVEKMSAEGASSKDAVAKVVAELGEAAQQIAKSAGVEPAAASAEGATLEGVRATLVQIRAMVEGGKPSPAPAQPAKKNETGGGQPAPDKPAGQSKIDQLLAQVATLAKGLTDQAQLGQRIAQLEKHFGLPNSTPAGERPSGGADEDENDGWSLDLNRPVDRESVDKSVSFHDL